MVRIARSLLTAAPPTITLAKLYNLEEDEKKGSWNRNCTPKQKARGRPATYIEYRTLGGGVGGWDPSTITLAVTGERARLTLDKQQFLPVFAASSSGAAPSSAAATSSSSSSAAAATATASSAPSPTPSLPYSIEDWNGRNAVMEFGGNTPGIDSLVFEKELRISGPPRTLLLCVQSKMSRNSELSTDKKPKIETAFAKLTAFQHRLQGQLPPACLFRCVAWVTDFSLWLCGAELHPKYAENIVLVYAVWRRMSASQLPAWSGPTRLLVLCKPHLMKLYETLPWLAAVEDLDLGPDADTTDEEDADSSDEKDS